MNIHIHISIKYIFFTGLAAIPSSAAIKSGEGRTEGSSCTTGGWESWNRTRSSTMPWPECGLRQTAIPRSGGTKYTTAGMGESASSMEERVRTYIFCFVFLFFLNYILKDNGTSDIFEFLE